MRFLTTAIFAALLSTPAFAADLGTYRPGVPYNTAAAPGADVCENQCAGDAQCRGWNYVKRNPRTSGICEFLSTVSMQVSSPISISGLSESAGALASRVRAGETNTIRVGTTVAPRENTVKVGQTSSGRRIVRQAPTQRIAPQLASTRSVQNMSLTEQQNQYRQQATQQYPQVQGQAQRPVQPFMQPQIQRPMFRPMLDNQAAYQGGMVQGHMQQGNMAQPVQGSPYPPQVNQSAHLQVDPRYADPRYIDPRYTDPRYAESRLATGPSRDVPPQNVVPQNINEQTRMAPQIQRAPDSYQGSGRPPIGQPIQAPQSSLRSTPSQRLAQFTAQNSAPAATQPTGYLPNVGQPTSPTGAVALKPEQASQSLFGRLHDDVKAYEASVYDNMPTVSSVPTGPVMQETLGAAQDGTLAGGY